MASNDELILSAINELTKSINKLNDMVEGKKAGTTQETKSIQPQAGNARDFLGLNTAAYNAKNSAVNFVEGVKGTVKQQAFGSALPNFVTRATEKYDTITGNSIASVSDIVANSEAAGVHYSDEQIKSLYAQYEKYNTTVFNARRRVEQQVDKGKGLTRANSIVRGTLREATYIAQDLYNDPLGEGWENIEDIFRHTFGLRPKGHKKMQAQILGNQNYHGSE